MTPKPSIHQQKVLLCVWWTTAGIVHYELLPSGQTITAEIYSAQLDRVLVAFHQKQAALANRKGVVFHQDNATAHRKNHAGNSSTFTMGDSTSPSVFTRLCAKRLSPVFDPG